MAEKVQAEIIIKVLNIDDKHGSIDISINGKLSNNDMLMILLELSNAFMEGLQNCGFIKG